MDWISKIKITALASFGYSFFELRITMYSGREEIKYLKTDLLKEKGIIKKADSFKKATIWLNTEEGKQFADEFATTTY